MVMRTDTSTESSFNRARSCDGRASGVNTSRRHQGSIDMAWTNDGLDGYITHRTPVPVPIPVLLYIRLYFSIPIF
jgi:hypothetical protein